MLEKRVHNDGDVFCFQVHTNNGKMSNLTLEILRNVILTVVSQNDHIINLGIIILVAERDVML